MDVERHLVERGAQGDFVFAADLLRGPIVVPIAWGQLYFFGVDHLSGDWCDEEVAAEKEITVIAVEIFGLRIVEEYGTHGGKAGARAFFHAGVDVGEELVTQLHVAAANGFVLWPVHPWLLIPGAF